MSKNISLLENSGCLLLDRLSRLSDFSPSRVKSICCFRDWKKTDSPWCVRAGRTVICQKSEAPRIFVGFVGASPERMGLEFLEWSECRRPELVLERKHEETSTDPLGLFKTTMSCSTRGAYSFIELILFELDWKLVEQKFWSQDCRYQKPHQPPNGRNQGQRVRISFFRITRCSGSRLGNLLLPNLLAAKGLWASWHA